MYIGWCLTTGHRKRSGDRFASALLEMGESGRGMMISQSCIDVKKNGYIKMCKAAVTFLAPILLSDNFLYESLQQAISVANIYISIYDRESTFMVILLCYSVYGERLILEQCHLFQANSTSSS